MPLVLTLTFPTPSRPLSMNERVHHMERRRRLLPWKEEVHRVAQLAKTGEPWQRNKGGPSMLQLYIGMPDGRRRDPSNYMWVQKTIVDQLVKERLWPDDSPQFLTEFVPRLEVNPDTTVEVWPRGEEKMTQNRRGTGYGW